LHWTRGPGNGARAAQPKDSEMPTDTNRENEIFRMFAGALMFVLIMFGVVELMGVIHV
jgi:hypothetical protein